MMRLKIIILILVIFVVSISLIGCRNPTSTKVPDQSIPFLTLIPDNANNENVKKATLNFWDLKNGKIIQTDKVVYTVAQTTDINNEQAVYEIYNDDRPVYWDGKDCIVLPWFFKSETNLYKRTEIVSRGTHGIFGKDVEMIRIPTDNNHDYKYTVKLWSGKEYIQKELNLNYKFQGTNSQPSYPIAVGNERDKLNILVSGGYNPQTGIDLFLCTINKKDWTTKWYKISVENDTGIGPGSLPLPSNTIYLDGSFYLPGGGIVAKVDIKDRICKKWKEMSKEITGFKPSEEDIAYNTSILGSFKDMIIIQFTVSRAIGTKHYICVFKNGKNVGIMYLIDGNVNVMDRDGNILSNTTLNENPSIIFPKMNGGI